VYPSSIPSSKFPPGTNCLLDITLLSSFVAAAKQNDDRPVAQGVVDTITGPDIDAQFPDAISAERMVTEIPGRHAVDTAKHGGKSPNIAPSVQPLLQRIANIRGLEML
jgi:hypothetical protein